MKQLIVMMAILPLLLLFVMQFSHEQQKNASLVRLQEIVYASKEKAKQDGCFTDENIMAMKRSIGRSFGIPESDIQFAGTTVPKYRVNHFDERELIYYRISVPIRALMAGAGMLGIRDEENSMVYTIDSFTASERLCDHGI